MSAVTKASSPHLSAWRRVKLGDVCSKPQYGWTTKATQSGGGLKLLRTTDITSGQIDWATVPFCTESPSDVEKYLVREGDILISRAGSVGVSHLVTSAQPAVFASYLIRFKPGPEVLPKYLAYFLQSPDYWKQIADNTAGIAVPNVNASKLQELELSLAPPNEQQRVVAEIEKQFSRLDEAVLTLERIAAAARTYRNSVLSSLCADETSNRSLGSLLREPLRNGHSAKAVLSGAGVPTFTLTAVTEGDFSDRNVKQTSANPNRVRDLWVKKGDIFVERSNTPELVGTARLYRGKDNRAIFPDLLIRVRVNETVLPEWVELCLLSPPLRRYFKSRAQGIAGSMPKIDQAVVDGAPIPVPSIGVQEQTVADVERRLSIVANLEMQARAAVARATRLRNSVLESAFCII